MSDHIFQSRPKAIILAAGLGNRLRPHTDESPKCMVPLAGVPLIERQISVLRGAGIDDITIIGGYKVDKLQGLDVRVLVNERFASTNMVTTFFIGRDLLDEGQDVLVCYGDIVYEPDVLKKVLDSPDDVSLVSDIGWQSYWEQRVEDPFSDVETFKVDDQGHIAELGKKPNNLEEIQGQFTGLFQFRANRAAELTGVYDALDRNSSYDGKSFDNMYMTSFLQHLIDIGWKIKAIPINHGWLEVDTVDDLELYHRLAEEGRLDQYCKLC